MDDLVKRLKAGRLMIYRDGQWRDILGEAARRIEALEAALQMAKRSILEAPPDILVCTLWVADGTAETVVDMIDAALDAAPRSDGETSWQRCRIGSCHRHEACMYVPCRTPPARTIDDGGK